MHEDIAAALERLRFRPLDPESRRPSSDAVDRLQVEAGCTLSDDYVWFLGEHGPGGFMAGAMAPLPSGTPIGVRFNVDLLYGLGSRDDWNPFLLKSSTYQGQLPSAYLPIASDPGGNLLLLECGAGSVFAWDHEHRELGPKGVDRIVKELSSSDIDVSRYDLGQLILMWENGHRDRVANPTGHGNIYPVAGSFTELVTGLQPLPE